MQGPKRVTPHLLRILRVLVDAADRDAALHGWTIARDANTLRPTAYKTLDRLRQYGWLTSRWAPSPHPGSPRRRMYRLTKPGKRKALALLLARSSNAGPDEPPTS